jgi:hypothetical protein
MIVLKLEMWPHGNEDKKYEIGRTYIYNSGGTNKRGDYEARVCRKGKPDFKLDDLRSGKGFARRGSITDYPRLSYNVWRLIIRALKACFPEETK